MRFAPQIYCTGMRKPTSSPSAATNTDANALRPLVCLLAQQAARDQLAAAAANPRRDVSDAGERKTPTSIPKPKSGRQAP